jgi:hypothetical protein
MVSKYHESSLKIPRSRPLWSTAERRDLAEAPNIRSTARPVLILRMARLSPKVQLVALVGSGQPDA